MLIKTIGYIWLSGPRYYWSRFKRFFFERKYKKEVELPKVENLRDIQSILRTIDYKQDGLSSLFDCVSYPETTYALKADDCDGYATLAIHLLKQLGITGYYYTYIPKEWKKSHTVCIFYFNNQLQIFNLARLYSSKELDFNKFKKSFVDIKDILLEDVRDINFKKAVIKQ